MSYLDDVQESLHSLRSQCARLAEHLESAAAGLAERGQHPAVSLLEDLSDYRSRFQSAAGRLGMLETDLVGDPVAGLTLADLEQRLSARRRVHAAKEIVDRALRLQGPPGATSEELNAVRAETERLHEQLTSWPNVDEQVVETLLEGLHPLHALCRLAEESDGMSDSEWREAIERIRQAYGETVATAAARGRLSLSTEPLE